jgi:Flp pilus assembly protein CpaB
MDMEYRDEGRRRSKLIIGLGVVLALGAGAAAFFLLNQAQQQAGQGELKMVDVAVAVREIPARKVIEAEDVAIRSVPLDPTNERGVLTDLELVVGRVPAVTIFQDQLVTSNLFASTATGAQFSILGPSETVAPDSEAWRAISVTVSDDRAVAGLVQPGMTVDVFVTATVNVTGGLAPAEAAADEDDDDAETTTYYTDKSTKLVYQDVIVLARSGQMYIIRAALDIAEEITHLQATGNAQFSFALRPEVDTRLTDATALGSTTNELIRKYALPIPEVYPPAVGPIPTPEPTPEPTPTPTPDEVETGAGRLPEASPSQVP